MNGHPARAQPPKLLELEGLRGLLAWWVVFGHMLIESGWQTEWLPTWGRVVINSANGVKIFIILSGFVITLLLDKKKTSYREFIAGRFFRLFPLYYITVALGACSLGAVYSYYPAYLARVGNPVGLQYLHSTWHDHLAAMPTYLAVCFTGLHGAVPNGWLPNAQSAYVSQAWSISLEWQFYLVAPLLVWSLKRFLGIIALPLLFYITLGIRHHFNVGDWSSFLPQNIEFFALGSVSYLAYKYFDLRSESPQRYSRALLAVIVLVVGFVPFFPAAVFMPWPWFPVATIGLSLGLWLIVLMLVIARKHAPDDYFVRLVSAPLTNRLSLFFGRISYSTYLTHYFAIFALQWAMLRYAPGVINKFSMTLVLCTVGSALTLLLSILGYKFVEVTGVALGKRLLSPKNPVASPESILSPTTGLPSSAPASSLQLAADKVS